MNCSCGGWQFYTVAEIDGRERLALKCMACKKVERVSVEAGMERWKELKAAKGGRF